MAASSNEARGAIMKEFLRKSFRVFGLDVVPTAFPKDFERPFEVIAARCAPFTMTPRERLYGLHKAVQYVVEAGVAGDIVECGVWRGGSCMAVALTLSQLGVSDRDIYLYDTFAGMTEPGRQDVDHKSKSALQTWRRLRRGDVNAWCLAPLDEVKRNLASTGYPTERMHFIAGDVLQTVPASAPQSIAILRLDTDFYESTKHTMAELFPRLSRGGVLIVDDYGHWQGAKKAVDEFFAGSGVKMLLNRLDYAARIGVKT